MIPATPEIDKLSELKARFAALKAHFARKLLAAQAVPSFFRSSEKRVFRMQQLRKAQVESNKIDRLIKEVEDSLCSKKP